MFRRQALVLRDRGQNVNRQLVGVGIVDGDKFDAGLHQSRDEREVAREAIELRNDKPRLVLAAGREGFRQFGALGALAALDLDMLGAQFPGLTI
jgi:hypothetical protein